MINVAVNEKSLNRLTKVFGDSITRNVEDANSEIGTAWAALLVNQQRRFHRSLRWPPLDPTYLARKRRMYRKSDVRYLVTLKRTGRMMEGYLEGIQSNVRFSDGSLGVSMSFPPGDVGIRAMVHQDVVRRPKGVPARPFDLDEFTELAVKTMDAAIKKGIDG
jgi:hypothetical protein